MDDMKSVDELLLYIKNIFHDSVDLVVEEIKWEDNSAVICYYSVMNDATQVNSEIELIRHRAGAGGEEWWKTASSTVQPFSVSTLIDSVISGSVVIVFPYTNLLLKITIPKIPVRSVAEPDNEHVIRGPHEGFVEGFDINIGLIRKHLPIPDLIVKSMRIGSVTNTRVSYVYIGSIADEDIVTELESRLENIRATKITDIGQLEDFIEDSIWSPFPQLLNTERPDRVVANLLEGKIAIFTDSSPVALVAPVNFFSFYESPDDYNTRVIVGTFYRILRHMSFMAAIFLPAFYISVISFHSEIIPIELGKQVRLAVNDIPYPALIEALILELFIELIRESAIRLPTPIGQTIGIVGGLVIGNAIVDAGLVSNFMIIVVAMTAISSFVVPSWEMNMTIRIIRFPFMILASMFGFFGMAIGTLVLLIHLLSLSSLKQPYFTPVVPFDGSRFKSVFFRIPYFKMKKQQKTFTHGANKEGEDS